jgi:uncharacterized protein YbjT (DUF2867 family)
MKVILFGATGMVGQGVLRECLRDPEIREVLAVVRSTTDQKHAKLRELVHENFYDFSAIVDELARYDACLFCLGVSSAGMSEADYHRITYDITMAVAEPLAARNPKMTFIYVSGAGTDSTEKGGSMWARVKGKTENALLGLPFESSYMFRPAFIQPMHGIKSKTRLYRALYAVTSPLYPVWKTVAPKFVTSTEQVGRAMIDVAMRGADKRILENSDINAIAMRVMSGAGESAAAQ